MMRLACLPGVFLLCSACAESAKTLPYPRHGEPTAWIYLINHGMHTGLGVRRADIPRGLVPETGDFPGADYLELGWGDEDYYQAGDPGLWLTLQAALWPTASVLHVVGVRGAVAERFAGYEIVRLKVSHSGFVRLAAFIHNSFARDGAAKAEPIGPGWGRDSLFYPAREKFHLFYTCNGWTASALEAAGYSMGGFKPFMAEQLMAKVRAYGAAQHEPVPLPEGSD